MSNQPIRLMSYNVRGLKDDRAALKRVVDAAAPDVLCLQEVPRHPFSDHRVAAFADDLGLVWGGGKRHRMSTTVFTSLAVDVHASGHGLYSVPRPQEPRGYGWVVVSFPGGPKLMCVSTHMSLYGALRGPHAEELMADPALDHALPWVVAGDFNELEDGPAGKVMKRTMVDAGPRDLTSPSVNPEKRIDFVYASPSLQVTPVELGVSVEDLERATDHRPVVVDVTIPESTTPRS